MKTGLIIGAVAVAALVGFGVYIVDIEQTQEASLPSVEITGGQIPEFTADVGDISTAEETITMSVPKLKITPPEEEVGSN